MKLVEKLSVFVWNLCFGTPLIVSDEWIDTEGVTNYAPRWRWSRPHPASQRVGNGRIYLSLPDESEDA